MGDRDLPVIVRTVEVEPATGEDLSLAAEEAPPAPTAPVAASIVLSATCQRSASWVWVR